MFYRIILIFFLLALARLPARAGAAESRQRNEEVDRAIDKALLFLKNQQNEDGSWNGPPGQKNPAITSLAVMAFLSSGHVPGEGPHGETVEKGVRWVLAKQDASGVIATVGIHEMYHHGICTLMLAEVAGMTQGALAVEIKEKLEKAVKVILEAQRTTGDSRGGWRYRRDVRLDRQPPGDISVTGWQIMALRASKNLGCDVPPEAIDNAVGYIKRCNDPASGGFRYLPGGNLTVACTGTSILALELCGKELHRSPELLKAGAYLLRNLPVWGRGPHFSYAIYYCSQAAFQLGGTYWTVYRQRLHEILLTGDHQNSSGGWYASDGYGPVFSTSMAVLALTVEYRFLPIYQRGEDSAEKGK